MATRNDRQTVALSNHVVDKAKELSAFVSKYGWSHLGIDREDLPTMAAIFDEAIKLLATRAKVKGGK